MDYPVFDATLEIRARGGRSTLSGRFPYSSGPGRNMATIRSRGRTRKERINPDAFNWQLEKFQELQVEYARVVQDLADQVQAEAIRQELERRNVHILTGHSFDKPMGDMLRGTARVKSTRAAVEFEVDLPDEADMPSYMLDTVKQIRTNRAGGVSPGFMVPPASVVAKAEELEPEPGNPGVMVRVINKAVLTELSIVTRPAYSETGLDVRGDDFPELTEPPRRRRFWL